MSDARTPSSSASSDASSESVLIVDDEPSIVAPLKFLMEQQSHRVRVVSSGEAVIPAMEEEMPALVLLDVMLPNVTGYELCERIREREEWDAVKIIMLTVKSRDADVEKGRSLGADAYITKPFAIQDVIDTAERLLGSPE